MLKPKGILFARAFHNGEPIVPRCLTPRHGELRLLRARIINSNSVIGYYGRSPSLSRQSPAN